MGKQCFSGERVLPFWSFLRFLFGIRMWLLILMQIAGAGLSAARNHKRNHQRRHSDPDATNQAPQRWVPAFFLVDGCARASLLRNDIAFDFLRANGRLSWFLGWFWRLGHVLVDL